MQFHLFVYSSYGIDWVGPVGVDLDAERVEVPDTPNSLNPSQSTLFIHIYDDRWSNFCCIWRSIEWEEKRRMVQMRKKRKKRGEAYIKQVVKLKQNDKCNH